MLSVIVLNVTMLSVIMPNVTMLSDVELNVIMLSVVAPIQAQMLMQHGLNCYGKRFIV